MHVIETDESIPKAFYTDSENEYVQGFMVYMYPTQTGLLSSATFTLYWVDGTGLERSKSLTLALTALSNFKCEPIGFVSGPEGDVSMEVAIVGNAAVKIMCAPISLG